VTSILARAFDDPGVAACLRRLRRRRGRGMTAERMMGRQMPERMMGRKVAERMMGRQVVRGRRRRGLLRGGVTDEAWGKRGDDDKGLDHGRCPF